MESGLRKPLAGVTNAGSKLPQMRTKAAPTLSTGTAKPVAAFKGNASLKRKEIEEKPAK